MDIRFAASRSPQADTLVYAVKTGGLELLPAAAGDMAGDMAGAAALARFAGECGGAVETFATIDGQARRILLLGVGGASEADMEKAGAALTGKLLTSGAKSASVSFEAAGPVTAEGVVRFALGAELRSWRIDKYRTKLTDKQKPTLDTVEIVSGADCAELWTRSAAVAEGVKFTRELVAEPANVIYPESFVERCRALEALGVTFTVLDEAEMAKLGMGALLGVAQGSVRAPRLLAMEWNGTGSPDATPLVLVGKGVTFDTGGISIKPAAGMEDMKWDMGGAGAVAGTMRALAGRKAKARVVGICGLVENMPDGNAQRPGDVVTSMSGQTIEVINTDAEGRLVLCDVITWAQRTYKPRVLIDLATLTGAMLVALGNEHAGLFSNDDSLADDLLAAGKAAGDPLWRFPLGDAYDKQIDSPIADMKNTGGRFAGSITAAQFIKRFIDEGVKWAHLDIAGMVWADKPGATWDKGATGYGVRLLDRLVADRFEA
ncbi:MAG: leucyl aminopeptidase [Sphingobium sp.]|jgi:leucyl aminopeptidase|nr:leucyl aminopeptidase [Sphingobium sp.]MCI2052267.1 leucyl aminopeptidase [Sphingobium sp.]